MSTFLRDDATFAQPGFGDIAAAAWTTFSPTVTARTGTLTSYTVSSARYTQIGKTVFFSFNFTITNNGTGATGLDVTLPVTNVSSIGQVVYGRENQLTGNMLQGNLGIGSVFIVDYKNAYAGGTNAQIIVSGTYEAA